MNKKIKKILSSEMIQNASKMLVLQIVTTIIGFISSIIIARTLGPEDKGKVDLFLLLTNYIVEFGIIGVGTGFLYYQTNQKIKIELIHGTSLFFCGIMGLIIFFAGVLFHRSIEPLFAGLSTKWIILAFCLAPLLLYRQISGNIIQGINKPKFNYQSSLLINLFMLVMVVILAFMGSITYGHMIIVNVFGIIIYIACSSNIIIRQCSKPKVDLGLLIKVMKYGIAIYIGAFANSLLFKMDQNFLNYYWGNKYVGCYSVAVNFAEMLWSLDGIINAVTLYHIASNEEKTAKRILKKAILIQIGISGFLGVLLGMFAPYLIHVLYGKEYSEAIIGIQILIPGIVVWSMGRLFSQYITLNIGKPFWCTLATIFGIVINYVLNDLWIPDYGIRGAASASVISYICVVIIVIVIFFTIKGEKNEQVIK